ncbi:hypothetical protein KC345_g37 [Hortaea werneckii]|nr:hypothetical protein KC345_g37 [Hortaea werneckii]
MTIKVTTAAFALWDLTSTAKVTSIFPSLRVLGSSRLASLELVKIPAANGQVATVIVHASPEVVHVRLAHLGRLVVGVEGGLAVGGLGDWLSRGGFRLRGAAAAAEEAADGVADRGAYCDTAGGGGAGHLAEETGATAALLSCWRGLWRRGLLSLRWRVGRCRCLSGLRRLLRGAGLRCRRRSSWPLRRWSWAARLARHVGRLIWAWLILSRYDLIGHTLSPPCIYLLLVNVGDCDRVASALPSQTVMTCWRVNAAGSHFTGGPQFDTPDYRKMRRRLY